MPPKSDARRGSASRRLLAPLRRAAVGYSGLGVDRPSSAEQRPPARRCRTLRPARTRWLRLRSLLTRRRPPRLSAIGRANCLSCATRAPSGRRAWWWARLGAVASGRVCERHYRRFSRLPSGSLGTIESLYDGNFGGAGCPGHADDPPLRRHSIVERAEAGQLSTVENRVLTLAARVRDRDAVRVITSIDNRNGAANYTTAGSVLCKDYAGAVHREHHSYCRLGEVSTDSSEGRRSVVQSVERHRQRVYASENAQPSSFGQT